MYLELVVKSKILLVVEISHGDPQLVRMLACEVVKLLKANPALS